MVKKLFAGILLLNSVAWQGCEYEVVPGPVNCDENPVAISLVSVQDANCAVQDGSIEVLASGGGGNYTFTLGNGAAQTSPLFNGLAAGEYEVTALDDNSCSATIPVSVKNINGLNITFQTTEAGCGNSNGVITVNAVDGSEPYLYKLEGGSFTSNSSFEGLSPGEYDLVVTDASGCEVSQPIQVKSGISFSESIEPIIEKSCAINDCHNGSQFPDFRVFKNIHDNAGQIKALTGDRTMPQEGTLTQAEIDMIACWVDDGAPDN